jgi:hypothetical protein
MPVLSRVTATRTVELVQRTLAVRAEESAKKEVEGETSLGKFALRLC